MKPLSNMQLATDIVIVAIGLTTAFWVFSKAVLNIVMAANHWTHVAERSDELANELEEGFHKRHIFVITSNNE